MDERAEGVELGDAVGDEGFVGEAFGDDDVGEGVEEREAIRRAKELAPEGVIHVKQRDGKFRKA